jgi:hypothetical protein
MKSDCNTYSFYSIIISSLDTELQKQEYVLFVLLIWDII